MPLLEMQKVCYENDNKLILKDISMNVEQGDFISIIGASGSGKSTLLRLCGHLISPTEGSILLKGKNFDTYNPIQLRKQVAYCFQTPYLFGDTVMDNINFPFSIRNVKYDEILVNEVFSKLNMSVDYLNKDIRNLSGGEKQRIALIRSLLFKPEILLLDEITSALDVDNTDIVEQVILSLNKEGITVLWITHNPEQSRKYANKVITIEVGEIKSMEVLK